MSNWIIGLDYYRPEPRLDGKPSIFVSDFTPKELENQYNLVNPLTTVIAREHEQRAQANQIVVTVCSDTKTINSIVSFDPNLPFIPVI